MGSTVSAFWIRIFIWATNVFPFGGPQLTVFLRFFRVSLVSVKPIEKFLVPFTNLNISSNITRESIDTRKLSVVSPFLVQDNLHLKRSRQNKRFSDHLNLIPDASLSARSETRGRIARRNGERRKRTSFILASGPALQNPPGFSADTALVGSAVCMPTGQVWPLTSDSLWISFSFVLSSFLIWHGLTALLGPSTSPRAFPSGTTEK